MYIFTCVCQYADIPHSVIEGYGMRRPRHQSDEDI